VNRRITRRQFLNRAALAAGALPLAALAAPCRAGQPPARRPNFLFFLTDDQGWGDARTFGHPYLKTPGLDRLASQSARFTQFYVSSPVCSPSRCTFMTSHYPARHGIHGHFADHKQNLARHMPDWLDPGVFTVTRLLKEAGYVTGHFGKWHLGHNPGAPEPGAYGIDDYRTFVSNGPQLDCSAPDWPATLTRRIVDEAVRFLRANRDRPFYLNVWTHLPHAPLKPSPEQLAVYKDLLPSASDPAFGEWMQKYLAAAKDLTSQMRVFAAAVTDLDTQLGRLLEELERLGLADDTVVVFSADNGPEDYRIGNAANAGVGSTGPLRARKRSLYEGGVRTPLLVRWPGRVQAGRVDAESVLASADFLPTVCALAGVAVPADLRPDGEDVGDILLGRPRPRRTALFWEWLFRICGDEYVSPPLAVRDGRWKLLLTPDRRRVELYDVPADPEEDSNVAAQHPDVVDRLAEAAVAWQRSLPPCPLRTNWKKPV